jgi:predicted DNA-binding WGR domain protein
MIPMCFAYLKKIDPKSNQFRFYTIAVVQTLFGEWAVVREWGRLGQAGTVREIWFDTEAEARAAGVKLQKRKERRGYQVIGYQHHP